MTTNPAHSEEGKVKSLTAWIPFEWAGDTEFLQDIITAVNQCLIKIDRVTIDDDFRMLGEQSKQAPIVFHGVSR